MGPISTPCLRICVLDPRTDTCEGCGRTRREIAAWTGMSEPERLAIMAALPERLRRRAEPRGRERA